VWWQGQWEGKGLMQTGRQREESVQLMGHLILKTVNKKIVRVMISYRSKPGTIIASLYSPYSPHSDCSLTTELAQTGTFAHTNIEM